MAQRASLGVGGFIGRPPTGPSAPCGSRKFDPASLPPLRRCPCRAHKRKRPESGALPKFDRAEPQAAALVDLSSRSLLELAIGIDAGFIASGISRTRSTCRSPFSRVAPLTLT